MRVLLVSPHPGHAVAETLAELVRSEQGCAEPAVASFQTAPALSRQLKPDVAFVVLPADADAALDSIARLRSAVGGHLLAVGPAQDAKLILHAMQAGADLFLDQDELETELEAAFCRLRLRDERRNPPGRLVGVLSASGGCGASTLAVNIAAVLAREHKQCCLIDLNAGRGDLAALLDLKPQYTLADLCTHQGRLDVVMFQKMLTRHGTGIALLAAPPEFSDARAVNASGVAQALALARASFPQVVVDLEDCFHDEQVAALQQVSGVLLVCRLDFTALRHARRSLDSLAKLGIARSRVKVVFNEYGKPNELPHDEAESALREKVTRLVPYDAKTVNAANNAGVPVVALTPQSKVAQSIVGLAGVDFEDASAAPGFLPKLVSALAAR
jgi:pilus assembly protein CpaE